MKRNNAFLNLHLRFDKCTLPIEEQNLQRELGIQSCGSELGWYKQRCQKLEVQVAKLQSKLLLQWSEKGK